MNNADILKRLDSKDPKIIKKTLDDIKSNGDVSIISSLLNYLENSKDENVKESIIILLSDIKRTEIRENIIEKIKSTDDTNLKISLLRVCWESPVDFSNYYLFFSELLANENFMIAFEAHTNLDEILVDLNSNQREELKNSLLSYNLSKTQNNLISHIISQIDNFIEDIVDEDTVIEDAIIQ